MAPYTVYQTGLEAEAANLTRLAVEVKWGNKVHKTFLFFLKIKGEKRTSAERKGISIEKNIRYLQDSQQIILTSIFLITKEPGTS